MFQMLRKRRDTVGLTPGALVHIGERVREQSRITVYNYTAAELEEKEVDLITDSLPFQQRSDTVTWIAVEGIHDVGLIEQIGKHFNVPPLVLETILDTEQRPKAEELETLYYVTLKALVYDEDNETVKTEQVSLLVGEHYLISLQEGRLPDLLAPVRKRLREGIGRVRSAGSDYLAFALIDVIVDNYFLTLEKIGARIEAADEIVIDHPEADTLEELRALKRQMITVRQSIWPLRDALNELERSDTHLLNETVQPYFRSVYEHVLQIMDLIDAYRDILTVALDTYMSSVNNRMTATMNVLTIIMSIFIPLTFIAGVYGMNFEYMPELQWRWGYPAVWGVMVAVAAVLLVYFKRRDWL